MSTEVLISDLSAATSIGSTDLLTVYTVSGSTATAKKITGANFSAQYGGGRTTADGVFDVTEYGAVGDGATDNATAFNAAFSAAYSAGGGTVYIPKGHYKFTTSTWGTANSILKIPASVADEYPFNPKKINIIGEACAGLDVATNGTYAGGVLLDFTAITGGSGTVPAAIACVPYAATGFNTTGCGFCDLEVTIDGLMLLAPANPSFGGINLANCINAKIGDDVVIAAKWSASGVSPFSGWPAYGPVQPTNTNARGLFMPAIINYRKSVIGSAHIMGWYDGVIASEHCYFKRTRISYCGNAISAQFSTHMILGAVSIEQCIVGIIGGTFVCVDLILQMERGNTTASPGCWWTATYDLYADSASVFCGRIAYEIANAGTGEYPSINTSHTFTSLLLVKLKTGEIAGRAITGTTFNGLTIDTSTGTLDITNGTTVAGEVLQNSQSTAYTCVLGDAGKHIYHPSSDNNARTFTIPANSSVAYPIGTAITFVNEINTVTIAITTDTLVMAGTGSTGSRTLAANGIATALKVTSTRWVISGTGLS